MDENDGFLRPAVPASRVIRMRSLKRGRDEVSLVERVKLERVLGLTVVSNAALDCDPSTEQVAYPAGCTIVFFNTKKSKQHHILNSSRKAITCLTFSPDGKYLATGECGHAPSVRVWNLADDTQVAEFQGHKFGINCVAFAPNGRSLVSVGSQHDMIVNVWDWRNNVKMASNKVSTRIKAISFEESGKYFVTVGVRHVKFWYLEYAKSNKNVQPVPLVGRSAILGEQRDNYFCDVACGKGAKADSTFAITKSGLLCEFNFRRLLEQWVELKTRSANCMTLCEDYIFVGCADGIVRCFSQINLQFLVTLPRTHYLGVDVAMGVDITHLLSHPSDAKYPDAIAVAYDTVNRKLTCVYNDHSLYVWDVKNIHGVGKSHSFLYHSACIWGVEMYPDHLPGKSSPPVPAGSFITCSSDDTIRVWNLNTGACDNAEIYRRNIYSKDLLKILYVDKDLSYLKDLDLNSSSGDKAETSYDGKNGVRCVRVSPDGQHLASGDREGNIRIHELKTLRQTVMIEAHDAEVLSLEYNKDLDENLLSSASRDRLIHVFNVNKSYECVQTLDDHSSSITSVRFLSNGGPLQMVSCSADKSIIFRNYVAVTPNGIKQFVRDHHVAGKTTLYDMEVDANQKHVLTACQDRNIRVYNVKTSKHSKTFKGSSGDDGTLIKVSLDNSGIYIATSCTDKSLSIYDYYSGECMANMFGHSELVTGLRFSNDCKRLISASGDGCIFVWKIPRDMVVTMQARLEQQAVRRGRGLSLRALREDEQSDSEVISDVDNLTNTDNEEVSPSVDANANMDCNGFRFSPGKLPAWALRALEKGNNVAADDVKSVESPDSPVRTGHIVVKVNKLPQGRWAERIENNEIRIATFSPDKVVPAVDSSSSLESHEGVKGKEEGAEFDGDAEDSDLEIETHYYPETNETKTEFTVNANDLEELRRSVRRNTSKVPRPKTLPSIALSSASGGDSDLEDLSSEADTPSVERDILTASTDGINLLAQRETYFRSQLEFTATENRTEGQSITSQYFGRNTAVINAARQTITEIGQTKKREELRKLIEGTRRTLQSSGISSPLRASQSICDLSRYHEDPRAFSDKRSSPVSQPSEVDGEEDGMRRAISLSDLSAPASTSSSSTGITGKSSGGHTYNNGAKSSSKTSSTSMQRCRSVGVLNRADSETELRSMSGLMRPTISSQHKVSDAPRPSSRSGLAKKKSVTQSSVNLTTVGVDDYGRKYHDKNNMKDLSNKAKEVTARLTGTTSTRKTKNSESEAPVDVASAPLTKHLCSSISKQAMLTTDNLVVLHNRLTQEANKTADRSKLVQLQQMAEELEKTAIDMLPILQSLTSKLKNNNSVIRNQLSSTNVNTSNFLGNSLGLAPQFSSIANSNPNLMSNLDVNRFSEMLVTMVQHISENQNNQKN